MAIKFFEAPQRVLTIAERLIEQYHDDLENANIAFVIREGAPSVSGGKLTLGKAVKFPPSYQPLMDQEYHFLIWLAEIVLRRDDAYLTAIIDHELYHCSFEDEEVSLRKHDIEEFNQIIERYGIYKTDLLGTMNAFKQNPLFSAEITTGRGNVSTVSLRRFTEQEVSDETGNGDGNNDRGTGADDRGGAVAPGAHSCTPGCDAG